MFKGDMKPFCISTIGDECNRLFVEAVDKIYIFFRNGENMSKSSVVSVMAVETKSLI